MNFFLHRWVRRALVLSAVLLPGIGAAPLRAEGLKSAQVSRLYNDVKLLPENQQARPAAVTDVVSGKAAVQTGTGSRAELVFTDKTLTRLGANTFFSFENGTRNLDLGKGTMLLQVPKGAGGAEIHTAAVTAAITGTTLLVEYNPKSYSKIIVLEGTVRAYLKGHIGESILIHAGEMLITPPEAKRLPDSTVNVDLGVLYATSGLLDDRRFGPLPSDRLVSNEINHQKGDVAKGKLHGANLFIAGLGTQVQVGNLSYVGATNTRITAQQGQDSVINLDHPGSGSPTPRTPPPTLPTAPPVTPTVPPVVSPTPVSPTPPVVSPTPVSPTPPVVSPTPTSPTPPVVSPTPVSPTPPVVSPTPVSPTPPVVSPTPPVVSPTPPVVSPTPPVVSPTPVSPTPPVVSPTPPVVSPTPVSPTPPVVSPTPVSPTPPVVSPTPPVVSPTPVSPTPPVVSPTPPVVSPTPVSPTPPPVSPTPTPGKTGPLVAIAGNDAKSPSLYDIDNTTAILTDPYITTQGVTSYGKIYRGSAAGDGAPSSFLLGASTPSSFDNQVGFDTQFDTGTQIGAFLFGSLAFTASPASLSTTGGPTSLALVAANGISAAPATTATVNVNGLTQVLLATRNGPISLAGVTFTDNSSSGPSNTALTLYARGTANSLSLNTAVNLDVHGSLSLYGEGGLNYSAGAAAPSITTATLVSGADLTIGGTIRGQGAATAASSVTANGNLTISSGGIATVGPLTLTAGGAFQSDGFTTSSQNALTITSAGSLTTTSNAAVFGPAVSLGTSGVLTLGGNTEFFSSLSVSAVGGLNVPGIVSALPGDGLPIGTATFGTSTGSISVGGQITASVVNFNVTGGDYSTASTAAITANTVNINAPAGNVSLSSGVYLPLAPDIPSTVTVTGNNITIPDAAFTPQTNQFFELTQPGTFTVPANASYTFDSLMLTNPDTAANPGSLVLGANSALTLNTATVDSSLSLADGATFTTGNATVAQTVTLTGAPTLNLSGVFEVKNTDGAADAFTATGAATINLSNPTTTGYYGLLLDAGNFNGGSATINGAANSSVNVNGGDFTTGGAVTTGGFFISGNVSITGALRAATAVLGAFGDSTATVGALSVQDLYNTASVTVTGDVTPYDRTQLDSLSPGFLGVGGNLNYAGLASPVVPTDLNGGQLSISVQTPFNLGPGAPQTGETATSYATGANFAGAALSPNADNLTAGNGGTLTISSAGGDFRVGDFTDGNLSTAVNLQGGNLTSAGGNTGLGGNGGLFTVNSAGNIYVNNNVTISAYGGDFDNSAAVTGLGTPTGGNGGTVTLNAPNGAIPFTDSTIVDLHGGAVGSGGASGGIAGNGGTLMLNAAGAITLGDNSGTAPLFNVQGGVNSQSGTSGNGGAVTLASTGGSITMEAGTQITADGGLLQGASGTAGNGGSVTLQAAGVITVGNIPPEAFIRHVRVPEGSPGNSGYVFLTADGGTADQSGLAGGNGGTINITSSSSDLTQSSIAISTSLISATTGGNSMTTFGGIGGTINITATDTTSPSPEGSPPPAQIDINNANLIASDDGTETANTPDSHSQVGGTINVTSMRPSGPGILVENGSILTALVNAGSTGAGGTIKLLTAGATIEVDVSTLQASGTGSLVQLSTQQPTGDGSPTSISLYNATVSGDSVSLSTFGPSDTVNVDLSTVMTGSTLTINAATIQLGTATVTADPQAGFITIDTVNPSQAGTVDIGASTLSAGTISVTAQGTGGSISVEGLSTDQPATLNAGKGDLTLTTPGASGSITISPDSNLTASGTLSLLAPGTNGTITIGTAATNNTDPTMLSADTLKMRALGTNGSIVINAGSTLSATNQLLLYADGTGGSITFQGGNITLNTGSLHGILAAPSITINTNTTVTVNGSQPIQVYTDHPNYSDDFGGNDNQSGGFAGTAQPSAAPLPFSSAPPYPTPTPASANAIKVAANGAAASPAPGLTPTPAPVATRGNKAKPAGTTPRVTLVSTRRPSIPFSALNPKDLSYDPGLLQGGSSAPAPAVRHGKARAGAADAARDKVRAATGRDGTGSRRPDLPTVLPTAARPVH